MNKHKIVLKFQIIMQYPFYKEHSEMFSFFYKKKTLKNLHAKVDNL